MSSTGCLFSGSVAYVSSASTGSWKLLERDDASDLPPSNVTASQRHPSLHPNPRGLKGTPIGNLHGHLVPRSPGSLALWASMGSVLVSPTGDTCCSAHLLSPGPCHPPGSRRLQAGEPAQPLSALPSSKVPSRTQTKYPKCPGKQYKHNPGAGVIIELVFKKKFKKSSFLAFACLYAMCVYLAARALECISPRRSAEFLMPRLLNSSFSATLKVS